MIATVAGLKYDSYSTEWHGLTAALPSSLASMWVPCLPPSKRVSAPLVMSAAVPLWVQYKVEVGGRKSAVTEFPATCSQLLVLPRVEFPAEQGTSFRQLHGGYMEAMRGTHSRPSCG